MVMRKSFALGMLAMALIMGCGGAGYRYYTLELPEYDKGKLKGPEEKEDLPMEVCKPNAADHAPCFVILSDEFFKIKRDLKDAQEKLKACEQGKQ